MLPMNREGLRRRPRHPFRLSAGLIGVSLGIVALIAGVPLLLLRDGGWPWMTTMSVWESPPSATATIVEDDGTVHRFTGTPTEMQAWVASTEDRLKDEHGIPAKIVIGQSMSVAGSALLAAGSLVLIRRWFVLRHAHGTGGTAPTPAGSRT
jgi:hypothetical protein